MFVLVLDWNRQRVNTHPTGRLKNVDSKDLEKV